MKAIEKAKELFRTAFLPELEQHFPEVLPCLAAGMAGRGSECFGYDDEISQDHDLKTGFTLWLKDEDEVRHGFKLQRFYEAFIKENSSPDEGGAGSKLGPSEHGVVRIGDFYRRHIGLPEGPRTWQEWLYTPEYAFAEAVNGELFTDNLQEFSRIRNTILFDMPEDVRLKKIAARLIAMAQSGQYNFERCLKHGEPAAAAVALHEFVRSGVSLIFLLNFRFAPYYKWQFRALRELPLLGELGESFEKLLAGALSCREKTDLVESCCGRILKYLQENSLVSGQDPYLEPHAFEVMKKIRSAEIRGLHVMEG